MKIGRSFWIFLLPLAFGAHEAFSDVVLLKDGQVVDCKIKDVKYPNPKNTNQFVVVAEVDEKGTIKEFSSADIKRESGQWGIYKAKTLWERRVEYEKEYDRKLAAVKDDSWQAQVTLGKWCKAHLLPDKAEEHFKTAYLFRVTSIKSTPDEHVKLARWCERDLGMEQLAEKEFRNALDAKRDELKDDSAASHATLGKWAESVDLIEDAVKAYEAALVKDARNSLATSALKRIKNSAEFLIRQLALDMVKSQRGWKITVVVQDSVGRPFLETWKKKMEDLSAYIFTITQGQFFIAEVEIEDNVQEGTIIIEKGKLDWRGLDNKQGQGILGYCRSGGRGGYEVHVPGLAAVSVLAHEVFHGAFGLPDEYNSQPMCDCVMKSAPNPQKICDRTNHTTTAAQGDCWGRITGRFKASVHPNTKWKPSDKKPPVPTGGTPASTDYTEGGRVYGELEYVNLRLAAPPPTKVTIVDN